MASTGSSKRKYRLSGSFSREDARGARSLERLHSLDNERSPRLVFFSTTGSYVKQQQESQLRSTSVTGSQPHLHVQTHSCASVPHNTALNTPATVDTTTTTTVTTNNQNNNSKKYNSSYDDNSKLDGKGLRRSSSSGLHRTPSKTLRDLGLIRLNRHSDVITRRGWREAGQGDGEGGTQTQSGVDPQQSPSSSPPSDKFQEGKDRARRRVSQHNDEVVMRRKDSNDKSPNLHTSEQSVSHRARVSRPSSLYSDSNHSGSSPREVDYPVRRSRPLSAYSAFSSSKLNHVVRDKDSSSRTDRPSSKTMERSCSLRELKHSTLFSDSFAFWRKSARSSFHSDRTVSLTNLSASPRTRDQEIAATRRLVNHNPASGSNSQRTDREGHGNAQRGADKSVSHAARSKQPFPQGADKKTASTPDLSVSLLSAQPPSLSSPSQSSSSSSPTGVQSILNYDGSPLKVLPDSGDHEAAGGLRRHSSGTNRSSALAEKTKDRATARSASPKKRDKPDDTLDAQNTSTRISSSNHVALENTGAMEKSAAFVSVKRFSLPSDQAPAVPPTLQSKRMSSGAESKPDSRKNTTADVVLGYLDNALKPHSTDAVSFNRDSAPFQQDPESATQPSENQNHSMTTHVNANNTTLFPPQ
ncbi:uncharacterized protein LOC143298559 [Babylonia areolata]|uniref:uncharacterized protein LOC143298559 n=1 Tax=Babylonia areolata TaxID=304850 RepID=UPI003FD1DD63